MRARTECAGIHYSLHPTMVLLFTLPLFFPFVSVTSQAQVTTSITPTIGTGNLGTTVTQAGNLYNLTGGTRPGGGPNLFHSFGNFSVGSGDIANFLNTPVNGILPATSNILARVTNPNPSNIFGTIQTTNFGNANLFLMNPAGIVFGPTATLNVGGSVHFTTANYLRLADNTVFNAIPNLAADALLSAAPVTAFGFLGSTPGTITVQGSQLAVPSGQSISLVGGNVTVQSGVLDNGTVQPARLSAPNRQIHLASAASPGEFLVGTLQPAPNVNSQSFSSFGSVNLAPGSTMDVSQTGTGSVSIRGGQFVLTVNNAMLTTAESPSTVVGQDTVALSTGSSIVSATSGTERGADVAIVAGSLRMDGAAINSTTTGGGRGGDISINAQTVNLTNGAQIVSATTGTGSGGNIAVDATQNVSISGFDVSGTLNGVTTPFVLNPSTGAPAVTSGIYSLTSGTQTATGGAIAITAPSVSLDNGAMAATVSSGDGAGGNVSINAAKVSVTGGASILSSTGLDFNTFDFMGSGQGGDITITASDSVLISGGNPDLGSFSNISSYTWNPVVGSGHGGNILISAPNVTLENAGINALFSTTQGSGDGGDISIGAKTLTLTGGSAISTDSAGSGAGGTIAISASDGLSVAGGSTIQATTEGAGNSGAINIGAGTLSVDGSGSAIQSETSDAGSAGNLRIQVTNDMNITEGGTILTRAGTTGAAGSISIQAGETISVSGQVISQFNQPLRSNISNLGSSFGGGSGTIEIQAKNFILSDGARVENTSLTARGGNISIHADESIALTGIGTRILLGVRDAHGGVVNLRSSTITIDQSSVRTRAFGIGDAGGITLNAADITISNGQVSAATQGPGRGGNVTITTTDKLSLSGQFTDENGLMTPGGISSQSLSTGNAGRISITTGTVNIGGGARIDNSASNSGNAGAIDVQANTILLSAGGLISSGSIIQTPGLIPNGASGTITIQGNTANGSPAQSLVIDGASSGILTNTQGTGAGGNINILAQSFTLQNGGVISAATSGTTPTATGGAITVNANQTQLTSGATMTTATSGPGNAGNILVNANTLNMIGGAMVTASSTGSGKAGTVTMQGLASPAQSVTIDGAGTGIFTSTANTGSGGNIILTANAVQLSNGGTISASSTGTMAGAGNAGNIAIAAGVDFQSSGGTVRTTAAKGQGGDILITAGQDIHLTSGASISASSTGPGNAGNITALAVGDFTMQNSSITTQAAQASGGNIKIGAQDQVVLQNSLVSASVQGGSGSGGNIDVDPTVVVLQNSQILAQAVLGNGGNITITTPLFLADQSSVVSASSQFGLNGTVTIQSPTSNLSGTVASLPSSMRQAHALQTGRCAALANSQSSSFLIAGRETVPTEPGGWLPSPFALVGDGMGLAALGPGEWQGAGGEAQVPMMLAPADGTVSVRRLTPAGFLTQSFAEGGSTGCRA